MFFFSFAFREGYVEANFELMADINYLGAPSKFATVGKYKCIEGCLDNVRLDCNTIRSPNSCLHV